MLFECTWSKCGVLSVDISQYCQVHGTWGCPGKVQRRVEKQLNTTRREEFSTVAVCISQRRGGEWISQDEEVNAR